MRYLGYVLFLSLPGLIVALLAMEGALRLSGYMPYYLDGHAFVPSQNPEVLYELRPGFKGLYAGVPISINSQGFRGSELSKRNGQLAVRVVVVGDSIAFGQGVREGETLADQVAARLEGKLLARVEVINLGVPTYNTCQEFARFKERALPLEPQVALLIYVDNDTDPPLFQVNGDAVITSDVRTGLFGDFMAALRKSSTVYNFVWARWQVLKIHTLSVNEYKELLAKKFNEGNPRWKQSRACLAGLIDLARERSIRMIVIPFPELRGFKERPYPFTGYIQAVCDAARADGAECLDVVPILQPRGIRLRISNVETHPSADVYLKIAEHVAEMLP